MTSPPLHRPTLLPGLFRTWRGARTLQLGLRPGTAVLIDLPQRATARLLDLLDGSRSERDVLRRAATAGVPPSDARALLDSLHHAGLVVPAQSLYPSPSAAVHLSGEALTLALGAAPAAAAAALRRRGGARITVAGSGRLAAGIAVALAESGVGHVHADLPGTVTRQDRLASPLRDADLGKPRAQAVTEAVLRAVPVTETRSVRRGGASLVVQLSHDQPVPLLAAAYAQRRQPHLMVAIREATPVVGPLVPATGGPCLHCLDLHRHERDPHAERPQPPPGDDEPCAAATVLAATAYAVAEVLAFVDGRTPETLGAEVELSAPGRVRRRSWMPHPDCFCMRSSSRVGSESRQAVGTA